MDSYRRGTKKTIVRLQSEGGGKRPSSVSPISTVRKLVIRLLPGISECLRAEMRYRGDLSKMIIEAINSVDLKNVILVDLFAESRIVPTMISLPTKVHAALKALSKTRTASMNVLVNTAVAHWLAGKGIIKLA